MKIILEGPDGAGKTTLAEYIKNKYDIDIIHSTSKTKNDLRYHINLTLNNNFILDRANLGEIVYPIIYNRVSKMNWVDQLDFMNYCRDNNILYIIFYASNFEDLKNRLYNRGDTDEVLQNAEKINIIYMMLAKMFKELYKNVHIIDISKEKDQIKWFNNIIGDKNE